jgi:hypothetical protein
MVAGPPTLLDVAFDCVTCMVTTLSRLQRRKPPRSGGKLCTATRKEFTSPTHPRAHRKRRGRSTLAGMIQVMELTDGAPRAFGVSGRHAPSPGEKDQLGRGQTDLSDLHVIA